MNLNFKTIFFTAEKGNSIYSTHLYILPLMIGGNSPPMPNAMF